MHRLIATGDQMPKSAFTDLVGCVRPVQLAGMGAVGAGVALPAAVSQAGGLGMIGAAGTPVPRLHDLLEQMSRSTTGPFGVNFLIPFLDPAAVVVAAQKASIVEFFFGAPDASLVDLVHEHRALAGWQVGSSDEAAAAVAAGCDYVVAQGIEAGGHVRGEIPLIELLNGMAGAVSVPLVAAGGVANAGDASRTLEAGASAVRAGTLFLAAAESDAHPVYVDALIGATAGDTALTRTFSMGWDAPHRVLRACIHAAEQAGEEIVGTVASPEGEWPVPRFSMLPPTKDARGNVAAMCMYAGTSVDGVRERRPAAAIVEELTSEL